MFEFDTDEKLHRRGFKRITDRNAALQPIRTFWHRFRAHDSMRLDEIQNDLIATYPLPTHIAELVRDEKTVGVGCLAAALWFETESKHDDAGDLYKAWLAVGAAVNVALRLALVSHLSILGEMRWHGPRLATTHARIAALVQGLRPPLDLGHAAGLYRTAKSAIDDHQPEKNFRHHMVACRTAALAHGDRDIKDLLASFQRLEKPIELREPAAGWDHRLRTTYPWFSEVIGRIAADQRVRARGTSQWALIRPVLLVGPPGIGKSRFARALADEMGLPFQGFNFGGQSDARALLGTARGWGTAVPSAVVELLRNYCCANPVVFVDEIDKSERSHNGDPRAAILGMMEPTTSRGWEDPCLRLEVDLSQVGWIAGANALDRLDAPILSRFQTFRVSPPGAEHWPAIRETMLSDITAAAGLSRDAMPDLDREVDVGMCDLLKSSGDLRRVRRVFENVVGIGQRQREAALN
jgi:hypothetical protein